MYLFLIVWKSVIAPLPLDGDLHCEREKLEYRVAGERCHKSCFYAADCYRKGEKT